MVATALVEQRAHAAGVHAADEIVADVQSAVLTRTVATGPLPGSSCASMTAPTCATVRIRLEVENFGLQQNLIEQRVDVRCPSSRDLAREVSATELLQHDTVLKEVLLHLHRICAREIDLVDRDDHRHAGVLGVRDRFDRLRHHLIVSSDDEHDDVGHLCAARAHGRECFVTRSVEKRDRACRPAA